MIRFTCLSNQFEWLILVVTELRPFSFLRRLSAFQRFNASPNLDIVWDSRHVRALFVSLGGHYYLQTSKENNDRRGKAALTRWRTAVVDQLSKRHNASVDWIPPGIDIWGIDERLYTVDVEKMFVPAKPILFVGNVIDMIRMPDSYEIVFTADYPRSWEDSTFLNLAEIPFQFRLLCTEDFAQLILKQRFAEVKSLRVNRYAVVANIIGIPKLGAHVAAYLDYFQVEGTCRDLMFLGQYGFRQSR